MAAPCRKTTASGCPGAQPLASQGHPEVRRIRNSLCRVAFQRQARDLLAGGTDHRLISQNFRVGLGHPSRYNFVSVGVTRTH